MVNEYSIGLHYFNEGGENPKSLACVGYAMNFLKFHFSPLHTVSNNRENTYGKRLWEAQREGERKRERHIGERHDGAQR